MILIDSPLISNNQPRYSAGYLLETEAQYYASINLGGTVQSLVLENISSGTPISLPSANSIISVISNGTTYTPAVDPASPKNGEFVWNPYTKQIQIYTITEVRSLIITATPEPEIDIIPPPIQPPYPSLFTRLPLKGAIQLNKGFEQQPSAAFEFEVAASKSSMQSVFAPGAEIDLYGVPLRIGSVSIKEMPRSIYNREYCKVSVSLSSRWENHLDLPIFLRPDGGINIPTQQPYQDPDCTNPNYQPAGHKDTTTTVAALFAKARIPYIGLALAPVDIPADTPKDATVDLKSLLQERSLLANGFIRWSNAAGVQVVPVNGAQVWSYSEDKILGEIDATVDAIAHNSKRQLVTVPNLNPLEQDLGNFPSTVFSPPIPALRNEGAIALGFEYANSELSGKFSQIDEPKPAEKTQGQKPRYVRREPKRETRIEGDANAHVFLEGVTKVQTMSLCHDLGGQTKTRTFVTTENGDKINVVTEIWGFCFTAVQVYDDASASLKGSPKDLWRCTKRTSTDYVYDENTGYLIRILESGFTTVRFKQESAESPETLHLDAGDAELPLYKFIDIPVINRTSYQLQLLENYSSNDYYEAVKVCNRDGTSSWEPLINPNFAPPYYIKWERTESVSYASHLNPANDGLSATDKKDPNLIVGEESQFESTLTLIPATYEQIFTSTGVSDGKQLTPQRWVKVESKFKAQGVAIATSLTETTISEGTGDPPLATRRTALYDRVEDKVDPSTPTKTVDPIQYRYLIQTDGYSQSNPVSGSENFPLAKTLQQALIAARAKVAIENWKLGFKETFKIPANFNISEGDRFNYFCNGEYRQRVVLGASTELNILGIVDGQPRITGVTSLTLGRWILPEVRYSKIPIPPALKPPQYNLSETNVINQQLGGVLPWAETRSRRNP